MAEPMKIRAAVKDGVADVRILMSHPMETGTRKDAAGKLVPAWHITEVSATLNGKTVLKAQWGTAVSKDPFLSFRVRGAKAGDRLVVTWVDNKGGTETATDKIA